MVKFTGDTILAGLVTDSDLGYKAAVHHLADWCNNSHLHLNTKKTKEVIIDSRKRGNDHDPVQIENDQIEQMEEYKLSWTANTDIIFKKAYRRLNFLRCLRQLRVDRTVMMPFFNTFIIPILCFHFLGWFRNLTPQSQNRLRKFVNIAKSLLHKKFRCSS